ncbi:MAG: ATP-binding protein [Deltaproteobacteria bacterium]|nr:ATP-binding protein [Deltaproteobacteria bacterium]
MTAQNWETLNTEKQRTLLEEMSASALAQQYGRSESFFGQAKAFFADLPKQTGTPRPVRHDPPKDLIVSARRDLSFYEANFELFDNSIDEWRRRGIKKDLHIYIRYDLELLTGKYTDDAGGMEEADVFRVFIPGETTNRNYQQNVIGSFGMGAKKGIFRLADGAKVVSCPSGNVSFTSEVPEKWEEEPSWETHDGQAASIAKGTTEIYFFKLFDSPTLEEIDELQRRAGIVYAPLLTGKLLDLLTGKSLSKRVHININDVEVKPCPDINWSSPKGAEPRIYKFSHAFPNFLNTGCNIELNFLFHCGLTRRIPGRGEYAEPDWGIDVYGNGRLIDRFLKDPFGFGTLGMSKGSQASKFFRGQLFINGDSFAIPWDTHKREYLADHPASLWLRPKLRPLIKQYITIGERFTGDTELRKKVLELSSPENPPGVFPLPVDEKPSKDILPRWEYKSEKKTTEKPEQKPFPTEEPSFEEEEESNARLAEANGDERSISISVSTTEYDELWQRFTVNSAEELETAILDCLVSGVAFTLEPEQLVRALEVFKCNGNVGDLSDKIRAQLLRKIS